MSWVGVLEHHAEPHAGQADRRLRRRRRHLPARWSSWSAASGRRPRAPGASAPATSSGCSRTTASSSWPRSSPPTTSARSPCRSTGGWPPRRCAFILDHSQARALVCDDELRRAGRRRDRPARPRRPRAGLHLDREPSTGWERFADLAASDRARTRVPRVEGDDLHRLMYTSGTTGRPEGRDDHPRQPGLEELRPHHRARASPRDDVGLACGPLYHVGALDLITTTMIAVGATTIIHRAFDAAAVVDEIERSRVTLHLGGAGDGAGDPRRPRASRTATSRRCG